MSQSRSDLNRIRGDQSVEYFRLLLEEKCDEDFVYENGWNIVENIREMAGGNCEKTDETAFQEENNLSSFKPSALLDSVKDFKNYSVGDFRAFIDALDDEDILDKKRNGMVEINVERVLDELDEGILQYLKHGRLDKHIYEDSLDSYDISHYLETEKNTQEDLKLLTAMSEVLYEKEFEEQFLVKGLTYVLDQEYDLENLGEVKVRRELGFFHDLGFLDQESGLSEEEYFTVSRGIKQLAEKRYGSQNC